MVLAFSRPPDNNRFVRSKRGTSWWRREPTEERARYVESWLKHREIRCEIKLIDLDEELRKQELRRAAARHEVLERASLAAADKERLEREAARIAIKLDRNRDRTSGRKTYASFYKEDLQA